MKNTLLFLPLILLVFFSVAVAEPLARDEMALRLDSLIHGFAAEAETLYPVSLGQKPFVSLPTALQAKVVEHTVGPETLKIREFGAAIASDGVSTSLASILEGHESSVQVSNTAEGGLQVIGEFHTHPWKYPQLKNITFSPQDIQNLYRRRNIQKFLVDYPYIILAGDVYFALVVRDASKALARFQSFEGPAAAAGKTLNDYMYDYFYQSNRGNGIEDITNNSVIHLVGKLSESGIGFYRKAIGGSAVLLNP